MGRDRKDQETKKKANKVIELASGNATVQLLHAGTILATACSSSYTITTFGAYSHGSTKPLSLPESLVW